MDEYRMDEHRLHCKGYKHFSWLKYLGFCLAAMFGAFLAFYVVTDCTMKYLISPVYGMNHIQKFDRMSMNEFERFDREMDRDFKRMSKEGWVFQHKSAVEFIKTPDSYKFVVDLTPFQGNADLIKVDVEGAMITISGESSTSKNNFESFTKMSQSYTLSPKAKPEKLSKKKVDNKYIITVPIED